MDDDKKSKISPLFGALLILGVLIIFGLLLFVSRLSSQLLTPSTSPTPTPTPTINTSDSSVSDYFDRSFGGVATTPIPTVSANRNNLVETKSTVSKNSSGNENLPVSKCELFGSTVDTGTVIYDSTCIPTDSSSSQ